MITANDSADAIHTDVPLARLTGGSIHHGVLVLVVEVLPLGNAVQLTLIRGWVGKRGELASWHQTGLNKNCLSQAHVFQHLVPS